MPSGSSLNDNVSNDTHYLHTNKHKHIYVTYCINYILSAGMLNYFNCHLTFCHPEDGKPIRLLCPWRFSSQE